MKNMKHPMTFMIPVLLAPLAALAAEPFCALSFDQPEKIINVNNQPQFFAKVKAQGDYIFYISQDEGNHLLSTSDTSDATRDVKILGSIDPVPSPDGKILTIPGLSMFLIDDVIQKRENARAFYQDRDHSGVYQSVAILAVDPQDSNIRTYRVVVDGESHIQYRDYKINFNKSPPEVKPLAPVATHCPNASVATIMISKTGRYVTGFDFNTNTTKIFDMTDITSDHRCRELYDLGHGTGKVEFNLAPPRPPQVFNFQDSDQRLAFHLDYFNSNIGSYFSGVESSMTKDVYTMDLVVPAQRTDDWKLKVSNVRRLFAEPRLGSGGYYPSFTEDGHVVLVFDDNDAYSFRLFKPENSRPYDFFLMPPAPTFAEAWRDEGNMPQNWKQRFHRAAAIGMLWGQTCLPADTDQRKDLKAVEATSFFLSMSPEACSELVRSKWAGMKAQLVNSEVWRQDPRFSTQLIEGMDEAALLEACAAIKPLASHNPPIEIGTPTGTHLTKEQLMHHYCMGCHVPGGRMVGILGDGYPNTVDFTRGEGNFPRTTLSHLLSSRRRVETGLAYDASGQGRRPPDSMPPVNRIEPADRTDIDHGGAVLNIINEDIQTVMAMPKRVPLYLRDGPTQRVAEGAPATGVHFVANNQPATRFSMPSVAEGAETRQSFELVNDTDQEITEIGASTLETGFFYPGTGLFPGQGGNCGSSLAAHGHCTFEVGFGPSRTRQMYQSQLTLTYVFRLNDQRVERSVVLSLDGLSAQVARN